MATKPGDRHDPLTFGFPLPASIPSSQPAAKGSTVNPSKEKTSQEKYQTQAIQVNPFHKDLPCEEDLGDNPIPSEGGDVILYIAQLQHDLLCVLPEAWGFSLPRGRRFAEIPGKTDHLKRPQSAHLNKVTVSVPGHWFTS
jgi:hypothetical protein